MTYIPRIRVTAYNSQAIPRYQRNWFSVVDRFGDLLQRNTGSTAGSHHTGFPGLNLYNQANVWTGQPQLTTLSECRYIHLNVNGGRVFFDDEALSYPLEESSVFGIILQEREHWADCLMSPPTTGVPAATLPTVLWQVASGSGFETRLPRFSPSALRVMCVAPTSTTAIVGTTKQLPKNPSFRADLAFSDRAGQTPGAYGLFTWSDGLYGVLFQENLHPALLRKVNGVYRVWSAFPSFGKIHFRGPGRLERCSLSVRHLAGWLLLGFGINSTRETIFAIADPQLDGPYTPGQANQPETVFPSITSPQGAMQLEAYGCRVSLGFAYLLYAYSSIEGSDDPITGTIERTLWTRQPPSSGVLVGEAKSKGWALNSTKTQGESSYEGGATGGKVTYVMELTSSTVPLSTTETLVGIETPLVTEVLCYNTPGFLEPSAGGLDITGACRRQLNVKSATPPSKISRTCSLTVDRDVLTEVYGFNGWKDYLNQFRLIKVELSEDAGATYREVFYGYAHSPDKQTQGKFTGLMELKATDQMYRLMPPHAVVDVPAYDLGWIAIQNQANLYGVDGYQKILEWATSAGLAASLNGGDLKRFYRPGHPPILHGARDRSGFLNGLDAWTLNNLNFQGQAVTNTGSFLPPPWFRSYLDWTRTVADLDGGMIYYWDGIPGTVGGSSVPLYGDPIEMERAARSIGAVTVFDAPGYTGYDETRLYRKIGISFLSERNINRVVVAGHAVEGASGFMPALIRGEAQLLDEDDYNSPADTWQRTWVLQRDYFSLLGSAGCRTLASRLVSLFGNRPIYEGQLILRGKVDYQLWQKIHIRNNDPSLEIDGADVLSKEWEQTWNFDNNDPTTKWETQIKFRPLMANM